VSSAISSTVGDPLRHVAQQVTPLPDDRKQRAAGCTGIGPDDVQHGLHVFRLSPVGQRDVTRIRGDR
jgi:hypothetical protein